MRLVLVLWLAWKEGSRASFVHHESIATYPDPHGENSKTWGTVFVQDAETSMRASRNADLKCLAGHNYPWTDQSTGSNPQDLQYALSLVAICVQSRHNFTSGTKKAKYSCCTGPRQSCHHDLCMAWAAPVHSAPKTQRADKAASWQFLGNAMSQFLLMMRPLWIRSLALISNSIALAVVGLFVCLLVLRTGMIFSFYNSF